MPDLLSKEDVAHVAHLARLAVTDEQLGRYAHELSTILAYVDQLQAVDTTGVEPVGQVTGLVNVLQNDEPAADSVDRAEFLDGAPAAQPPHLKVRAVLE